MDIAATKVELIGKLIETNDELVLEKLRNVLEHTEEQKDLHSVTGLLFTEGLFDPVLEGSEEVFKMGDVLSHPNIRKEFKIGTD